MNPRRDPSFGGHVYNNYGTNEFLVSKCETLGCKLEQMAGFNLCYECDNEWIKLNKDFPEQRDVKLGWVPAYQVFLSRKVKETIDAWK